MSKENEAQHRKELSLLRMTIDGEQAALKAEKLARSQLSVDCEGLRKQLQSCEQVIFSDNMIIKPGQGVQNKVKQCAVQALRHTVFLLILALVKLRRSIKNKIFNSIFKIHFCPYDYSGSC